MHLALCVALLALAAAQSPKPTLAQLGNFSYDFGPEDKRTVLLKDGIWKDPEEGGSTFELMKEFVSMGDLDGDKADDAAVMIRETSSGTGRFYFLFVVMNRAGKLVQLDAPEWLGDRSVIQRVTIDRRRILAVRFITHTPNDPACCPTLRVENRYRVEKGKLVPLDDPQ